MVEKRIKKEDEEIEPEDGEKIEVEVESNGEEEAEIEVKGLPEMIERLYAQLDTIKETLTEIAEAIRSGAEAQKALSDVVKKSMTEIEKKIEEITKVERPEVVERETDKFRTEKRPEASGSQEEVADEITDPDRTANIRMPEYLKSEEIAKNAENVSVVQTPRPEIDNNEVVKNNDEVANIIKGALEGKMTMGELGEKLKKIYGLDKLVSGGVR